VETAYCICPQPDAIIPDSDPRDLFPAVRATIRAAFTDEQLALMALIGYDDSDEAMLKRHYEQEARRTPKFLPVWMPAHPSFHLIAQ
jgi:hypothetical protein